MDRAETNQVKITPEQDAHDAKARFLAASSKVDVLDPLRKHPWTTVMSAVVVGAVAGSLEGVIAARTKHAPEASAAPLEQNAAQPKHGFGKYAEVLTMLQPVLASGAKMLLGWWAARQQAQMQPEPADLQNTGNFE